MIEPKYATGFVLPQTFHASLEVRRVVISDPPQGWIEAVHEHIRWSRFGLLWCAVGAQLAIEGLLR